MLMCKGKGACRCSCKREKRVHAKGRRWTQVLLQQGEDACQSLCKGEACSWKGEGMQATIMHPGLISIAGTTICCCGLLCFYLLCVHGVQHNWGVALRPASSCYVPIARSAR